MKNPPQRPAEARIAMSKPIHSGARFGRARTGRCSVVLTTKFPREGATVRTALVRIAPGDARSVPDGMTRRGSLSFTPRVCNQDARTHNPSATQFERETRSGSSPHVRVDARPAAGRGRRTPGGLVFSSVQLPSGAFPAM